MRDLIRIRFLISLGMALSLAALGAGAQAPADPAEQEALKMTPNKEHGREVYEVCASCHLPEGWGQPVGTFPQISGQHRNVIIKQIFDFRSGNRVNPIMLPFTTDASFGGIQGIADVAAYVEALPMTPSPGLGPGDDLQHGETLYKANCAKCHGEAGEGDNEKFYPRIQGQHYPYLLRQFQSIRDGSRKNANAEMIQQIQSFQEKDVKAVLDYVSRLKPPADKVAAPGWTNPDFD